MAMGQIFHFFYHFKIFHKNFGIRQFSSSIIKSNFGSGGQIRVKTHGLYLNFCSKI
jgi:hypothetical protein